MKLRVSEKSTNKLQHYTQSQETKQEQGEPKKPVKPVMDDISLRPDLVEASSDDQLWEHIGGLRKQLQDQRQNPALISIAPAYVSKIYRSREELDDAALSVDLARRIGVRTPRIRRVVSREDDHECIIDRVYGSNLMDSWTDIGWFKTIRLGIQLRQMVSRMRSQNSPTAGSLGTGIARTFWLEDTYGIPLRASPIIITSLVNFWYNYRSFRQESRKSREEHISTCDGPIKSQPLVFTHHDLAPRNLMLDEAGDLWIVDWDFSGWYPPFFEHAGMYNFHPPENWGWIAKLRWKVFAWIATGFYSREKGILFEGQRKAIRFPAGRRFSIKAGATPSTKAVDD